MKTYIFRFYRSSDKIGLTVIAFTDFKLSISRTLWHNFPKFKNKYFRPITSATALSSKFCTGYNFSSFFFKFNDIKIKIAIKHNKWIGYGPSCLSKIPCGSPTISEILVNYHQDFLASTHSHFLKGQRDGILLFWPNHSWETFFKANLFYLMVLISNIGLKPPEWIPWSIMCLYLTT